MYGIITIDWEITRGRKIYLKSSKVAVFCLIEFRSEEQLFTKLFLLRICQMPEFCVKYPKTDFMNSSECIIIMYIQF